MKNRKPRVAFVVQRCGLEVNGGAELHCRQVAQRMSKYWDTEILTTCAVDYMTWSNFYPPGSAELGGIRVRRFRVDQPRDVVSFDRLSVQLRARQGSLTLGEQEDWMRAQGPVSVELLSYLEANENQYDLFIFFGYLYATTYFGLPLVREKAYLAPLAHDEWTIYFSMWDRFMKLPKRFIFNTSFERDFLQTRFPGLRLAGSVTGVGLDAPPEIDPNHFRQRYGLNERFLLYVGRVDQSKGCKWLLDSFIAAGAAANLGTKIVMIGQEVMPIPFHDDVIHLGFVSDTEKMEAMAACDWLVVPSLHESLSMVLLEAWAAGRPALVNGEAAVLIGQCRRAHGGLWYRDWNEFESIVRTVDDATKRQLGSQGRDYVSKHYSWERVEGDYLELVRSWDQTSTDRADLSCDEN